MGLRQEKLADEIRDVLAVQFSSGRLNDHRLESITITRTRLTPDLQICYVFFRLYTLTNINQSDQPSAQEESSYRKEIEQAIAGLERAAPYFKKQVAAKVRSKKVPNFKFIYDDDLEKREKIDELLHTIEQEKKIEPT